jgi:hypothetical protein
VIGFPGGFLYNALLLEELVLIVLDNVEGEFGIDRL